MAMSYDFINEWDKLLTHLGNIDEVKESKNMVSSLNASGKNSVMSKCLKIYKRVLEDSNPKQHFPFILKFWDAAKKDILLGYKVKSPNSDEQIRNDKWMSDGSHKIVVGDEKNKAIIYLSMFYRDAVRISTSKEEELKGFPEKRAKATEIIYPDIFLLHLYRSLTVIIAEKSERDQLLVIVRQIEKALGITSSASIDSKVDPLSGLLGNVAKKFKDMGMNIPTEGLDMDKITETMSGIMNNEKTQGALSSIFKATQGASNIGEVLNVVKEQIKNTDILPESMKAMADKTLDKGAQILSNPELSKDPTAALDEIANLLGSASGEIFNSGTPPPPQTETVSSQTVESIRIVPETVAEGKADVDN